MEKKQTREEKMKQWKKERERLCARIAMQTK